MKIELTDINKIIPYINNPRKKLNSEKVASSIKEFGFQQPIVVDKSMTVIVGHTRLEAAKKLGLKKAPVVIADLPPLKAKAYRIADNRLNEDSEWDFPLLNLEFTDLLDNHYDLDNLGFNNKELEKLITNNSQGLTDEDLIPEKPKKPKTKLGDIYKLEKHILLCGDATKKEDYEKLMKNKKSDMVFTDPPYGLNYKYNSYIDVVGHEYLNFCDQWFSLLQEYTEFIFLTAGWKYNDYWISKKPTDMFYWIAKNKHSGGKLSHFRKIEPIFLFGNPKNKKKYDIDYFDFNNEYKSLPDGPDKHTCPKPVKFVKESLKILEKNSIVLDPFLGSGTTIIACEQTNNICYGMELDPAYCDTIIKRWQDYTGNKAKKI
tara:strand:- start:341 stop:1462 length:1122 start_codon:yes stop_codon:yes gene_type:complete